MNLLAADPLLRAGDSITFGDILFVIVKVVIVFVIGLVGTMFMVWFERKTIAGMQNRIGPNKAGPWASSRRWPTGPNCSSRKTSSLSDPTASCSSWRRTWPSSRRSWFGP